MTTEPTAGPVHKDILSALAAAPPEAVSRWAAGRTASPDDASMRLEDIPGLSEYEDRVTEIMDAMQRAEDRADSYGHGSLAITLLARIAVDIAAKWPAAAVAAERERIRALAITSETAEPGRFTCTFCHHTAADHLAVIDLRGTRSLRLACGPCAEGAVKDAERFHATFPLAQVRLFALAGDPQ